MDANQGVRTSGSLHRPPEPAVEASERASAIVLVVDDDPEIRDVVRWLLEQFEVEEVWACTSVANLRSRRLLEALGFRQGSPTRPLASLDPGDLTYRWDRQHLAGRRSG